MTPENFCYWLQGFFELNPNTPVSAEQAQAIAAHLQLVFKKETPPLAAPKPTEDISLKRLEELLAERPKSTPAPYLPMPGSAGWPYLPPLTVTC